jgi:3-dehydroquinate synthase
MKTVSVRLGRDSYDIRIGAGLLKQAGPVLKEARLSDRLVVITDPKVRGLFGNSLKQSLASSHFQVAVLEVPEGEEQKSLEMAGHLYRELTELHAERVTPLLALGGGVIGDLVGFVAATYLRGVPLVQIPTTLLAQVDSSIGGKVAVNYGTLKNRIGAFYQPKLVISDIASLKTLPAAEISDGLAEVIKYGVIQDEAFFTYLEENIDQIKSLDEKALEMVVFRCAGIKAAVVGQDERDFGLRNILNYGHTVGHAIESASDFRVRHGEAVAIGMLAEARISNRMGILDSSALTRIKTLIKRAGLPTQVPELAPDRLLQTMGHDKKVAQGKLRSVLVKSIGNVTTDEVSPALVKKVLAELHHEEA